MPFFVQIDRLSDSLILVDYMQHMSFDPRPDTLKVVNMITRTRQPVDASSIEFESKKGTLFYIIRAGIIYILVAPLGFSQREAFRYLLTILFPEFTQQYGPQLHAQTRRPYMFQEFESFIETSLSQLQTEMREPLGTKTASRYHEVERELGSVLTDMKKNIEDLLNRGDSLEQMGSMSSRLREDSKKYHRAARQINWELLWKQYGPVGGLGLFVILFFWWRFFW